MGLQDQSDPCYQDIHNLLCLPIFSQLFLINTSQTAASLCLIPTVQKKMILTSFTSVTIFMDKEFCEVFLPSFLLMCPDLSDVLVGERAFN